MNGVRRSGRISKEIPIVLLGTDTSGRVFSEETRTLVLSRHGAGILSRNKFSPDETLTMRLPGTGRETEIRLVGHLGEDPRGNVYGVAFSNPTLDFWQIDFPSPQQEHLLPPSIPLECCFCSERSLVQPTEIESDVYLASQTVLRFCDSCGQTTPWKHANGDVSDSPRKQAPAPACEPAPPLSFPTFANTPSLTPPAAAPQSAYAATTVLDEIVHSSFLPQQPAATAVAVQETHPAPKPAPPPAFAGGGKPNRRRHVRTRVGFTACIRLDAATEELVECDNVSKGGLCFRSRKRYEENATIQVAVPFSPGHPAIFVNARIKRVEELPGANLFRYGASYV
ncbi:MAG TPA: PilZ domain-containing protein [Candidatus Dormibacteraeota bacterium]|jgi:hypothetical protein|nr:PilZ domain-containing protein [Candidatus Dormibacteraeota bacterium]